LFPEHLLLLAHQFPLRGQHLLLLLFQSLP
jgi:hypothetical protein